MRLVDLENFYHITIQCHDNPDADSMGAGYALYCYFQEKNKAVRFIYSGKNILKKTNLVLFKDKIAIPLEYVAPPVDDEERKKKKIQGFLITVDCQYGAGNVTLFDADEIAIIDHHQVEITNISRTEINRNVGSCSTLVWKMMSDEGYSFNRKLQIGTALYYGLYTDTNQFSEIFNPLDMDMRDSVFCNKSMINLFRNSNISRKELETAGIALIRNIYNDDHKFSIIKSEPCDPNILGIISDFLLQVDGINTCVVYSEENGGFKISVRSCVKEVRANELASFLCEGIGSGGGHNEKAGGFIDIRPYKKLYSMYHSEAFFNMKMNEYYDSTQIIIAKDYEIDKTDMKPYQKRKIPMGYVKVSDILPVGTPITVRTLEGDMDVTVRENLLIMIGMKGEVYLSIEEKFNVNYVATDEKYDIKKLVMHSEYIPTIKNRIDGTSKTLSDYAKICIPIVENRISAIELKKRVKVFTKDDEEKYMLGIPGDYLAVSQEDSHDIFVVGQDVFLKIYEDISFS